MRSFLPNLLILLTLSVITLSAEELEQPSQCMELDACFEKCSETDEECMDQCDATFRCGEDEETPSEY
jgi:hypothetical protein